jgi:hypothetical protein
MSMDMFWLLLAIMNLLLAIWSFWLYDKEKLMVYFFAGCCNLAFIIAFTVMALGIGGV